jgi:type IV pilus assembly protein PilA
LPKVPNISACQSITDATDWTLTTQQKILAVAKAPSNARIEYDSPNDAPCQVMP